MAPLFLLVLAASQCPAGATAKGAAPPAGLHQWCEGKGGKKQGTEREWYADGKQKSEGSWKNGLMDGRWLSWREDGTQFLDETFAAGEPVGSAAAGPAAPAARAPAAPSPSKAPAGAGGAPRFNPSEPAGVGPRAPEDHPRAAEFRAFVRGQTAAEQAVAEKAVDELEAQLKRLFEGSGASMRRGKDPRGRDAISFQGVNGAGRVVFDLELQLGVATSVDYTRGSCEEQYFYRNPKSPGKKALPQESRNLDCRTLLGDPELGPAAKELLHRNGFD